MTDRLQVHAGERLLRIGAFLPAGSVKAPPRGGIASSCHATAMGDPNRASGDSEERFVGTLR